MHNVFWNSSQRVNIKEIMSLPSRIQEAVVFKKKGQGSLNDTPGCHREGYMAKQEFCHQLSGLRDQPTIAGK